MNATDSIWTAAYEIFRRGGTCQIKRDAPTVSLHFDADDVPCGAHIGFGDGFIIDRSDLREMAKVLEAAADAIDLLAPVEP